MWLHPKPSPEHFHEVYNSNYYFNKESSILPDDYYTFPVWFRIFLQFYMQKNTIMHKNMNNKKYDQ